MPHKKKKKIIESQKKREKRIKGIKEFQDNQKKINKMEIVSPYLSVIILNIKAINSPIKKQSG